MKVPGYGHEGALRAWGLLLLGLVLAWLSMPPGPAPWLILAGDAPFLALLFLDGGRRWKRWIFLYAMLSYAVGFHWLSRIHPAQVAGAAFFLTPVALVAGALIRFLVRRRISILVAAPTVLVFEEIARTLYMGGMPLPTRAVPLSHASEVLTSSAALFGAWGLVFLAAASSAWIYDVCRGAPKPVLRAALWVGTLLLLLAYGVWRRSDDQRARFESTGTDVLLAVQGNIPQSLKHSIDPEAPNRMFQAHLRLMEEGMRSVRESGHRTFAVLWPETMVPWPFVDAELAHRYPDDWENEVRVVRNVRKAAFLDPEPPLVMLGVIHLFRRGDELHTRFEQYGNHDSVLLVDPKQVSLPGDPYPDPPKIGERPAWDLGRNDKHVLVPGGEYTPLGEVLVPLRWFRNLVSKEIPELEPGATDQMPLDLRPAEGAVPAVRAATAICFELLFPARCRHLVRQGANVLLNTANYGWFGDSALQPQIRAVARLRAAENGVTVVVAGNTGPTVFYDPRGRAYGHFVDATEGRREPVEDDDNCLREGWAWGAVLTDPEPTPYVRWGDAPWWGLGALLLLLAILRTPRAHDALVTVPTYEESRSEGEGENL